MSGRTPSKVRSVGELRSRPFRPFSSAQPVNSPSPAGVRRQRLGSYIGDASEGHRRCGRSEGRRAADASAREMRPVRELNLDNTGRLRIVPVGRTSKRPRPSAQRAGTSPLSKAPRRKTLGTLRRVFGHEVRTGKRRGARIGRRNSPVASSPPDASRSDPGSDLRAPDPRAQNSATGSRRWFRGSPATFNRGLGVRLLRCRPHRVATLCASWSWTLGEVTSRSRSRTPLGSG
jgi:hypothetical protein